uniref:ABC-type cobalt transport system, ATPase component n=1 Tax=uncultured beta proteobacterium HF0130_04F21 TaxID=710819 RepID=E0XST5_9PROT|nr:ABC-type cobalt transport system, ATPase component [uncultured beta proteobacterium HF0130_04F21]
MVTFEKIYFRKEGVLILEDISVDIKNKNTGLIGDNGSGKSSFLRLIKKLELPSSGKIFSKCSTSLIFQNPDHQILCPTVKDEICFGLMERGEQLDIVEKKFENLVSKFQINFLTEKNTHELSEGEKQLVCILSSIMDEADLILLDEPFSSLDQKNQKKFTNFVLQLPKPIIMASHQLSLLENFDEIIWLDSGQIVTVGSPNRVLSKYRKTI